VFVERRQRFAADVVLDAFGIRLSDSCRYAESRKEAEDDLMAIADAVQRRRGRRALRR